MKFLFILLSINIVLLAHPSALTIVQESDVIRNASNSFYQRGLITQYKNAKKVDSMLLDIYSKKVDGKFKTIVKMLKPKKDKDKLIFSSGNSMWLYDSNSKAIAQISPQQRLMGQSSSSDVMSADFSHDYNLIFKGVVNIKNGKKRVQAYKIVMSAKNSDVSYEYVEYWVEVDNFFPIKAKFYSQNKDLLKTSYYRKFQKILGEMRPTQVLIIDGVDRHKATKLEFIDIQEKDLPTYWFNKEYLFEFSE